MVSRRENVMAKEHPLSAAERDEELRSIRAELEKLSARLGPERKKRSRRR
jgi:hypothetical protein